MATGETVLCGEFAVLDLPPQDGIEAGMLVDQIRRQSQQFAYAPVDHRDTAVAIHHDDALAHIGERGCQRVLVTRQAAAMTRQE